MKKYRIIDYMDSGTYMVQKRIFLFFWGYCKLVNSIEAGKKLIKTNPHLYKTPPSKEVYR